MHSTVLRGSVFALLLVGGLGVAIGQEPSKPGKTRVACIGASNTFGHGIQDRERNCYPTQLGKILGDGYEVRNFGVSGTTMLRKGDNPYWEQQAYRDALAFQPDIVVIDLGGNDTKPENWKFRDEFAADTRAAIEAFRALPSKPRVLLCLPLPAFETNWGINDEVIVKQLIPSLRQVAFETGAELIDLHAPFLGRGAWFRDHIHPNAEGAALVARIVGETIGFKADRGFDIEAKLAAQGEASKATSFYGYRQLSFPIEDGRQAIVVRPYVTRADHPYAWRGEFFGHEPQTDLALLQRGFHVVYVQAQDMFGGPPAMAIWEKAHRKFQGLGLDGKITLIGMSRGGLYCYHWAALHPETVAVLYGDAPVCDFKSWPGGSGRKTSTQRDWELLMRLYGFKDEAEAFAFRGNPVDNLEPLAKAKIPIIHVVGQADRVVPVRDNTDVIEQRYKRLGGTIEVIRKEGVDHHPHSLANPQAIVDFIMSHQP
ncbi:GDSL-type esterase/lipase family protein [Singulisphaera sp. PoT]|uniref:GDSL-type esterase/lipase family protein n=1 Tax=Singulisphaera sp. PoT TaxID=3411797 RepID=UPI003BF60006